VSRVKSFTPRHAVNDYLRSLGCSDDELEPIGEHAVAWRGAVYTGVETSDPDAPGGSRPEESA
jgi:hypothetical protein